MSASKPAAKYAESIPAVTAPVQLPRLAPRRAGYVANVATGAVLIVLCVAGLAFGVTL
ncbi:hypothetical protein [uncultured Microbacterium sp.]|uniref:hypothetical protein n=1 Tax=uncultured Microbacterium sp. TaxID=191216 RepID=UPI0025FF7307|nr:hypothetical protein [uncultured Microbacterium sp.]